MKWLILMFLGLVLFSYNVVGIESCSGFVNTISGNIPVTFSCGIDCSNEVYQTQSDCVSALPTNECVGLASGYDTFSSRPDHSPDGVGDVLHWCNWNGTNCINRFKDGDPYVSNSGTIASMCFGNTGIFSDPSCGWLNGSYVLVRQYCDSVLGILAPTVPDSDQCVYNQQDGYNFVSLGGFTINYPNIDIYGRKDPGFCLDYCTEYGEYVIDHDKCTDYGYNVSGWYSSRCPSTRYDSFCSGNILNRYRCDGLPTTPVDWSGISGIDGVNNVLEPEDCGQTYKGEDTVCDSKCGTVDNFNLDACTLGVGNGVCEWDSDQNAFTCKRSSNSDLDDDGSDSNLEAFKNSCKNKGFTGLVNWSIGGDVGYYGEYTNIVSSSKLIIHLLNGSVTEMDSVIDRNDWVYETCGDDRDEFFVTDSLFDSRGGLCCDDVGDNIVRDVVDNVDDALNMSGDYCYDNTGCGDFSVGYGEECDALFIINKVNESILLANGTLSPINYHEEYTNVLGDFSNCDAEEVCYHCQCVHPDSLKCGNNEIDDLEECDNYNLNDKACTDFYDFNGGILGCDEDCKYDFSNCRGGNSIYGEDITSFYGECICPEGTDCSNGVGKMSVITISLFGSTVETQDCFLDEEKIPFIGVFSIILVLLILFGFYFLKRKK